MAGAFLTYSEVPARGADTLIKQSFSSVEGDSKMHLIAYSSAAAVARGHLPTVKSDMQLRALLRTRKGEEDPEPPHLRLRDDPPPPPPSMAPAVDGMPLLHAPTSIHPFGHLAPWHFSPNSLAAPYSRPSTPPGLDYRSPSGSASASASDSHRGRPLSLSTNALRPDDRPHSTWSDVPPHLRPVSASDLYPSLNRHLSHPGSLSSSTSTLAGLQQPSYSGGWPQTTIGSLMSSATSRLDWGLGEQFGRMA